METTWGSGFIMSVNGPKKPGYVAELYIGLKGPDQRVAERRRWHLARDKAVRMALDLLRHCDAPPELLRQIEAIK